MKEDPIVESLFGIVQDARRLAAENERLREALHAIVCNTEPSAIKHRDYDHLANAIYVWASAALAGNKPFEDRWGNA